MQSCLGNEECSSPQAARNAAQVYFGLQGKRPQSMAEERSLQPRVHRCKTASHLLDLVQGVVVCADACIVDCGKPHHHRVSDAALHASHTRVRANASDRSQITPWGPNAMLHIPRAQELQANAVVHRADMMTMPALQRPKHMLSMSLEFLLCAQRGPT